MKLRHVSLAAVLVAIAAMAVGILTNGDVSLYRSVVATATSAALIRIHYWVWHVWIPEIHRVEEMQEKALRRGYWESINSDRGRPF